MSKRSGHDYQWLFEHLAMALEKAENDPAFNQRYGFYVQNSHHVQWPLSFLDGLAVSYKKVTGLDMTAVQLRTKIANTRVKAFITMAANAPWGPLMHRVNDFDPLRLTKHQSHNSNGAAVAPRKAHTLPRVQQNNLLPEYQPFIPTLRPRQPNQTPQNRQALSPSVEDAVSLIENADTNLELKLNALDSLSAIRTVDVVHSSLKSNDLRMAFLLSQHLKSPGMAKI